ncbi:hypothetical protein [Flagellimonas sp. 2504JD4-2]
MNTILNILEVLSPQEKSDFTGYLKKRNRRGDVKNIKLLNLIDSGMTKDLDVLVYGKPAKRAFHALCKRLQDTLVDFVASKSFDEESSEEQEVLKLLLAGRVFFEQQLYKIAFKVLDKAERKAKIIDGYSILNEIYHTKIQYSHLNNNWKLSRLVEDYEKNKALAHQDFQLNMAYARIKTELKQNIEISISELVTKTFSEFHLRINEDLTYKSLYQLMAITATTARLQNDFYTIAPMMIEVFNVLQGKGAVPEKYTYYYLSMLYLMASTEFRNKNFAASKALILEQEAALKDSRKEYSQVFSEKLLVLKALNEVYTANAQEAIRLLSQGSKNDLNKMLVLIMCFFQQSKFTEAYDELKELNRSDDWYEKKMGWTWVVKKNIIEILLLIELDKLDIVLNRFDRFSRSFNKRLQSIGEERVLVFMKLVKAYYENPDEVASERFKERVEHSFDWQGREQEDIFVMSFYAWLKAKMEKQPLYETTLDMVTL